MERRYKIITLICGIITLIALIVPHLMDYVLWDHKLIKITDPDGDVLRGTYYPGDRDAGVLLLEGFGSDQVTMRSLASEFARHGYHVMTFDFSGHGRSPGTLGYDNAETPRLAYQTIAALDAFTNISGLDEKQIVLVGHSLGARVALQVSTMHKVPGGLVLLGTQVNLGSNTQSEFFTGVRDTDLTWVQSLSPLNPITPVSLIQGSWDDILTPESLSRLLAQLGEERNSTTLPGLLHNYEVYSPRAITATLFWAYYSLQLTNPQSIPQVATVPLVRIICWIVGFSGMLSTLNFATKWVPFHGEKQGMMVEITNVRRFLWAKIVLWAVALPVGAVISSAFFFSGVGLPTFNLIYVAVIGGYGVLSWLIYRFTRLPGTTGGLLLEAKDFDRQQILRALALMLVVWIAMVLFTRSGWFYVFPLNVRLVWLVVFSLPTSLGFWTGFYEDHMLKQAAPSKHWPRTLNAVIGILPFFLYAGFLASLGSISGVVAAVHGLLVLWLCRSLGKLLNQVNNVTWVNAIGQALLLYSLILPQGVLFK